MRITIETEQEDDGRWIAEAIGLPGVLAYGCTREDAISQVRILAASVIADRLEHGEIPPDEASFYEGITP